MEDAVVAGQITNKISAPKPYERAKHHGMTLNPTALLLDMLLKCQVPELGRHGREGQASDIASGSLLQQVRGKACSTSRTTFVNSDRRRGVTLTGAMFAI